jgi:hypothetical protein
MKKNIVYLIFICGILTAPGCIRSRVVVTSQPSGADITINNVYRGRTPITVPFGWYWYYDFVIEKEGFQKIKAQERFHTPFWCWMPLDLVMEAIPLYFYDTKHLKYNLKPVEVP